MGVLERLSGMGTDGQIDRGRETETDRDRQRERKTVIDSVIVNC